jgi:hypothetical protein
LQKIEEQSRKIGKESQFYACLISSLKYLEINERTEKEINNG